MYFFNIKYDNRINIQNGEIRRQGVRDWRHWIHWQLHDQETGKEASKDTVGNFDLKERNCR